MLPALFGLFVAAACSLVERALCPIAQTWLARRMSAPLRFWSRSPPSHPFSLRSQHRHHIPPACDRYRALPDSRPGDSAPWRCRPPIPSSHPASLRLLSCLARLAPRCPHRTRIGELEDAKREARAPLPTPHPHPPCPAPRRHPPHLAPLRGSRCGSGNSRKMVR